MSIHGIGRKSASCFLAWTRKGEKVAMLDTHLLKYLSAVKEAQVFRQLHFLSSPFIAIVEKLKSVEIPKSTPSNNKLYDKLEEIYLDICQVMSKNPIEFDLEIWRYYSQGLDKANR